MPKGSSSSSSSGKASIIDWLAWIMTALYLVSFVFWVTGVFMPSWFEFEECPTTTTCEKIKTTIFDMLEMRGVGVAANDPVLIAHGIILVSSLMLILAHIIRTLYVIHHHRAVKSHKLAELIQFSGINLLACIVFGVAMNNLHEKYFYPANGTTQRQPLDIKEHITTSGYFVFGAWLGTALPSLIGLATVFIGDVGILWKNFGQPSSK